MIEHKSDENKKGKVIVIAIILGIFTFITSLPPPGVITSAQISTGVLNALVIELLCAILYQLWEINNNLKSKN